MVCILYPFPWGSLSSNSFTFIYNFTVSLSLCFYNEYKFIAVILLKSDNKEKEEAECSNIRKKMSDENERKDVNGMNERYIIESVIYIA